MRRFWIPLLLMLVLLDGCGRLAAPREPVLPVGDAPTTQKVLEAYAAASEVYSWFDLASLPYDPEDVMEEGDLTYYRVTEERTPTLAALRDLAETYFTPELADSLFALAPDQYRDINGALYTTGGGRGSNLYLLDTTMAAERADETRWTVTLTFWADQEGQEVHADGSHPVTTVGFSRTTIDYALTDAGWRFTSFCPSDGLDLESGTVYDFDLEEDLFSGAYQDFSDWELLCYLLHADGAYAEAPSDLLYQRFLERPQEILAVLAFLAGSPYAEYFPHNVEAILSSPGYHAVSYYADQPEQAEALAAALDACRPETETEQTVLDSIRAAYASAQERSVQASA